jgi:hypothetical protein
MSNKLPNTSGTDNRFLMQRQKNDSEILQDSLRYQRFTIPPHTHTRHHNSIEHSLALHLSKKSTTFYSQFEFWNSLIWLDPIGDILDISPWEAALMALSP